MKKPINYHIIWPGGNTTAIVEEKHDRKSYSDIANKIMAQDNKIEQVGFIEPATRNDALFRLEMMGGEFCGNASRAAAYFWAKDRKLKKLAMEASGINDIIMADIEEENVKISLPEGFFASALPIEEGILVDLSGISHILIFEKQNYTTARKLIEKYKNGHPATGVISVDISAQEKGVVKIDPLVWVKATDSFVEETACASGSVAAVVHMAVTTGKNNFHVLQPSGETYEVMFTPSDKKTGLFKEITLSGKVKYCGRSICDTSFHRGVAQLASAHAWGA